MISQRNHPDRVMPSHAVASQDRAHEPRHRSNRRAGLRAMSAPANARASRRSADGGSAEAAIPQSPATPESAAAPSPFTPIANYGFLSNCHTGALVAPDGTVDWLCVPRFDSPSVFGALLDRGAGGFRFGPFGINVPSDRIYEPGTNTLVTSWRTPTGWVVVRDALTMGPRRGEDTVTPHTRPPSDEDANHALVRTAQCIDGRVEIDLVCEPAFDYGRLPGEWTLSPDRHRADAKGGEQALRLQTDMLLGIEAGRARARHVLRAGETVYCALAWSDEALVPTSGDEAADQFAATTRFWRDWLARAAIPDHELGPMIQRSALTIKGLTYMPTGAAVAALTTSLPETPGGERNWDYRYTLDPRLDLPSTRAALPAPGLGGRRVHAVHGRPRPQRRWRPPDHVRDRRSPGSDRVGARGPIRLRRRTPRPHRQRRLRPAAKRRLRCRPRLRPAPQPPEPAHSAAPVAARAGRRPSARRRCGVNRTRASGRRAASRSTTSHRS